MTGKGGFWRDTVRRASAVAGLTSCIVTPALAAPAVTVSLPASTLDQALIALGRATGTDIISTEPALRQVRTRGLAGRLTVRAALARLLAGTGYRAVRSAGGGYRIIAAPIRLPPVARPSVAARGVSADVVVTGSKQRISLLRYPGAVTRVGGTPILPDGTVAAPSDLGRILPVIQTTQLGPGRNKVFVRGIADSSFNGTTLSTVSVYLDDGQVSASGPDPGLRLYDLRSVEVMEGPQGTLYGAGSIGGVVRLTSNPPDLDRAAADALVGVSLTRSGAPGGDLSTMLNVPLVRDRLAVRGVAYLSRVGGYIDDRERMAADVNRSDVGGGRVTVAIAPDTSWHVEAGGALQVTRTRDGQYAQAGIGPLARRAALAQPFTGDFRLGRVVIEKTWEGGLRLTSATGIAAYDTSEIFDASPASGTPVSTLRTDARKLLVSHEMRLSRSWADGNSWLAGASVISDRSVLLRSAGLLGQEADVTGVRNLTRAASAFGEVTIALLHDLSATLGARYTVARVDSEPSQVRRAVPYVKGETTRRVDPTFALSYRAAPGLAAFARHQTGFRTGGLAVARGSGRVANFGSDSIDLNEVGLRRLRRSATGVELSLSASRAHWTDIQADLLSRRGQPYTANIGDATVRGIEAALDWRSAAGWKLASSALYTDNRVTGTIADQSRPENRRLPETPAMSGYAAVGYSWLGRRGAVPSIDATVTYVGRSVLGIGDLLDTRQGGYLVAGAGASLTLRRQEIALRVDNLTDSRADRFAFGNPIGLAARDQRTPLQPRTLRLSLRSAW